MLDPRHVEAVLSAHGASGDPAEALVLADYFLEHDALPLAASALDRAFGLRPHDAQIARQRQALLDGLAIEEHGLHLRYVPAGTFLMGSEQGDPDEGPVHPVRTGAYWICETPITWSAFCDLLGWAPPPHGGPPESGTPREWYFWSTRICRQYCETFTEQATDWHAHMPQDDDSRISDLFGRAQREDPTRPFEYNVKPMVAVDWRAASHLGQHLSTGRAQYRLPTEAEWEKAARGGLIGSRHSWGDEPPNPTRCDFDHFGDFVVRAPALFPANGYGIRGMCGGVWEWTADIYDALAYLDKVAGEQDEPQRVLRGGSWADSAEACTVSFRMSRPEGNSDAPNIGFRLVRVDVAG